MSDEDLFEQLMDKWEEARKQGHTISAEDLCPPPHAPHLLDMVKRQIAAELEWETLTPPRHPAPETPQRVGHYTPFKDVGKGGMGEVFLARDEKLRRKVALKRMQGGLRGQAGLRRLFLREADITARLQHPGVVPIYDVMRKGEPWYAMRFIKGPTLLKAIQRFHGRKGPAGDPTAFHPLLRRFVAVCQTIAYAHSQGIVHRDIKPENVVLGRFAETMVLDWGLAKRLKPSAPAGDPLKQDAAEGPPPVEPARKTAKETSDEPPREGHPSVVDPNAPTEKYPALVGDQHVTAKGMGTRFYASPEQRQGSEDVGWPSDIYSLGATLYHLLTGKPPVPGVAPRQVDRRLPRALEAICLKAMAERPEDRYATAADLAADVQAFMDDRPVSCRREPLATRARRWGRKHQTLSSTLAVGVLMALLAISALVVQQRRANFELHTANANLEAANAEVKHTLERTLKRLGRIGKSVLTPEMFVQGADPECQNLLRIVQAELRSVAAEAPADQAGDSIRAASGILQVVLQTGMPSPSLPELRKQWGTAREGLQKLLQANPDDEWAGKTLALTYVMEAMLADAAGEESQARSCAGKALETLWPHVDRGDWGADALLILSPTLAFLENDADRPWALQQVERFLAALDRYEPAGADTGVQHQLGVARLATLNIKARLLLAQQPPRRADAGAVVSAAQMLIGKLLQERQDDDIVLTAEADTLGAEADIARLKGDWLEEWKCMQRAGEAVERVVKATPGKTARSVPARAFRREALSSKRRLARIGFLILGSADRRRALTPWQRIAVRQATRDAVGFCQRLLDMLPKAERDPDMVSWVDDADLALIFEKVKQDLDIDQDSDEAIADNTELIAQNPNDGRAYYLRGRAYVDKDQFDKAIADFTEAVRIDPKYAKAYCNRGKAHGCQGKYDKAIADCTKALLLDQKYADAYRERGFAYLNTGAYDKAIGDFTEAVRIDPKYAAAYFNRAVAWGMKKEFDKGIADFSEVIRIDPKYSEAHLRRGVLYLNKHEHDKAIADFTVAIRLHPKWALAYCERGFAFDRKREYDKAIADYTEAIRIDPKDADAYELRGAVYELLGQKDKAEADLAAAKRLRAAQKPAK